MQGKKFVLCNISIPFFYKSLK